MGKESFDFRDPFWIKYIASEQRVSFRTGEYLCMEGNKQKGPFWESLRNSECFGPSEGKNLSFGIKYV